MRFMRPLALVVAAAGLSFGLLACGDDSTSGESTGETPAAQTGGSTVNVQLGEKGDKYFLTVDKGTVPAGETTFVIDNVGTMHHEFVIFKTDLPADKLPLTADGKVDEEKAGLLAEAVYTKPLRGEDDHRIRDGRGVNFTINLEAGKYVLVCNLVGHYGKGQFVAFTVEGEAPGGATTTEPTEAPAADATVKGTPVAVQLGEKGDKYFLTVDKGTVPAGETTFVIDNVGTMHHEFVIFKTDLPADKLPLTADGKVDEDKAGLLAEAVYTKPLRGEDDHRIRDGRGVNFTINLEAGKYVLVCNLTGHYGKGQFVAFTVT
jgi:uncharacterized cupredoxin-like copper-binding protein